MKITGPTRTGAGAPARSARPAAGGFSLGGAGSAAAAGPTAATAGALAVGSVDALLALQAAEDPLERRRRAVRRGEGLLDRLETLKLALLGGGASGPALDGLARAVREQRDQIDDPRLEGVLDEIEARAAVELAKAEVARARGA